jgi:hypothetical protein
VAVAVAQEALVKEVLVAHQLLILVLEMVE